MSEAPKDSSSAPAKGKGKEKDKEKEKEPASKGGRSSKTSAAAPADAGTASKKALAEALIGAPIRVKPGRNPDSEAEPGPRVHKFWDTQPVPRLAAPVDPTQPEALEEGNIEGLKKVEDEPTTPYPIPEAYEWFTPDVLDPQTLDQIYTLLAENYVEDDDSMFRFNYSREFLLWALTPPGWFADWHVGVRVRKTGKIVAFISGIPVRLKVRATVMLMTEINFLCVHKAIRSKRLAPILIKEVTRRVHLKDIWQAVYTAGIVLPRPIARCQYWHRNLNVAKLLSVGFSRIPPNFQKFGRPLEATKRHYALPDSTHIEGIRPMMPEDVPQVTKLMVDYLQKFPLSPVMSEEEVAHWLVPRQGVVYSFVVEKGGKVTDLISFYNLPSTVIGNDKYKDLKAAYSFYNVATSVDLPTLMTDALVLAKQREFDVFNALDIMENMKFLKELKFGQGDGHLQYYLFNWRFKDIQPCEVGLVML
eukprot:RCo032951